MTRSTSTNRRPASSYETPLDRLLWEQIQERIHYFPRGGIKLTHLSDTA